MQIILKALYAKSVQGFFLALQKSMRELLKLCIERENFHCKGTVQMIKWKRIFFTAPLFLCGKTM